MAKPQVSYYVNVAQTIVVTGGLILGFKALRLEEKKAGIQNRPINEVISEDVRRVRNWVEDKFLYKQYTHH